MRKLLQAMQQKSPTQTLLKLTKNKLLFIMIPSKLDNFFYDFQISEKYQSQFHIQFLVSKAAQSVNLSTKFNQVLVCRLS